MNLTGVVLVVVVSTSLWLFGYFDSRTDRQLYLPSLIKLLLGKPQKPVYLEGATAQTLAIYILVFFGLRHLGYSHVNHFRDEFFLLFGCFIFAAIYAELTRWR